MVALSVPVPDVPSGGVGHRGSTIRLRPTGRRVAMNYVRTAILLAALTALLTGLGYLIGGRAGALIAFFVAGATNFFAYWNSDRLVLSMHGAQEVDEEMEPEIVHMVADLADRAGLPMPR